MLRSLDSLEEGFQSIVKKSKGECGDELERMRQFIYVVNRHFFATTQKEYEANMPKYVNSLVSWCHLELFRISGHILFLSCNGLYRNAFDNIRYALESIVQALYIDLRHPEAGITTKIEILKEVEDKREYHSARLIDELEINYKDRLKKEYKRLSETIHPSHKRVVATLDDISGDRGVPVTISCEEISKIYNSMKKMYDILFLLFMVYFPEVKKSLKENPDFIKDIKAYNLYLLSKALNVRLS